MAAGPRLIFTNDRFTPYSERRYTSSMLAGNVTSAPTTIIGVVAGAGKVTAVTLFVGTNGVDVTNPLSISANITNVTQGTTITSTPPAISKTAGTGGKNTFTAGTGITVAVINPANSSVNKGDILKITWTLTRTASPGTEIADVAATVEVTENQDYDPNLA